MKEYNEENGYVEPNQYTPFNNGYTDNTPNEYTDYNNDYSSQNEYADYNNNYSSQNEYADYNNDYSSQNEYADYNNDYSSQNEYAGYNNDYSSQNDAFTNNYESQENGIEYTTNNSSANLTGFESLLGEEETSDTISQSSVSQTETEDYEALTPEELEYERRRKAAIRRKKLAAREARRKKRLQQAIIRCSILLIIVVLLIFGFVKMITGIVHLAQGGKKSSKNTEEIVSTQEATTEEPVADIDEAILAKDIPADREAAIELITQQAATDPEMQGILDNVAVYPDDILRYVSVNSEMKQFVIDYPAKINITFDGNFNVDFTADAVPLFLQYDEQWGYADYGKDIVALRGAAPTCLSMAYTYLKQDGSMNPIKVADFATEKGYLQENGETAWTLMTEGASQLGLSSEELTADKESMIQALKDGKLIICSVIPGDFSKAQHFILIREYKDGFFYINDPASQARSQVGWDYKRLNSQVAKIWVISGDPASNPDSTSNTDDTTGQNTDNSGNDGTDQQDNNNSDTDGTNQQDTDNTDTDGTDQ